MSAAEQQQHIFFRSIVSERVKLRPFDMHAGFRDVILQILKDNFESRCTRNGYVRSDSIRLHKVSPGRMDSAHLNGDVSFTVMYQCEICNPTVGDRFTATVTNINKFGLLAHAGASNSVGEFTPVINVIIPKQGTAVQSAIDLDSVQIGDTLGVEVLGKKFELNDANIRVIGKAVHHRRSQHTHSNSAEDEAVYPLFRGISTPPSSSQHPVDTPSAAAASNLTGDADGGEENEPGDAAQISEDEDKEEEDEDKEEEDEKEEEEEDNIEGDDDETYDVPDDHGTGRNEDDEDEGGASERGGAPPVIMDDGEDYGSKGGFPYGSDEDISEGSGSDDGETAASEVF